MGNFCQKMLTFEKDTVIAELRDHKWRFTKDQFNAFYAVLCKNDYPNRLVDRLIEEVKTLAERKKESKMTDSLLAREIERLFRQYDDPANVDKLALANQKVEDVRVKVQDNMNNLVANQADLEVGYD